MNSGLRNKLHKLTFAPLRNKAVIKLSFQFRQAIFRLFPRELPPPSLHKSTFAPS